jgi:hypothetical protein
VHGRYSTLAEAIRHARFERLSRRTESRTTEKAERSL